MSGQPDEITQLRADNEVLARRVEASNTLVSATTSLVFNLKFGINPPNVDACIARIRQCADVLRRIDVSDALKRAKGIMPEADKPT